MGATPAQQQQYSNILMQLQQQQQRGMPAGTAAGPYAGAPGVAGQFSAAQLAAAQAQAQAAAYQMRVAVDKGRATEYDHAFVAEDTTAKDHADEVMRRCEEVTKMLRKTLGKHTDGDRWAGQGAV